MTNIELHHRFYELIGSENLEGVAQLVNEDVEIADNPAPPDSPQSGERHGRADFMDFLRASLETCEFEEMSFPRILGDGDLTVALGVERYRIRSTGKRVDTPIVQEIRWKDGKMVLFHEYYDNAQLRDAFTP